MFYVLAVEIPTINPVTVYHLRKRNRFKQPPAGSLTLRHAQLSLGDKQVTTGSDVPGKRASAPEVPLHLGRSQGTSPTLPSSEYQGGSRLHAAQAFSLSHSGYKSQTSINPKVQCCFSISKSSGQVKDNCLRRETRQRQQIPVIIIRVSRHSRAKQARNQPGGGLTGCSLPPYTMT